ncbi:MAG: hypothetical protein GY946_11970, partial [bacterium]|nr:hypothetical protein [bacterium]
MAKINWLLAPIAALLGASAWFQPAVAGSDLWWHLAAGRDIWANMAIPTADFYSWTFAGQEWMHHEWLWDVLYWAVYRVHPEAVAWFNLAVVFTVYSLAYLVALKSSGSRFAAGAALWMVAASAHWFLDIRAHLTTLLFVGIFLATRDRAWAHWIWPPLMVLWCNLHGGFVFGFGTIGLHVLVLTLRQSYEARALVIPWPLWISVALTGLAFLANPWGYRILEYPIAYLDSDSPFRGLVEWVPPMWHFSLKGFEGRFWLVAATAVIGAVLSLIGLYRGAQSSDEPSRLPPFPRTDPYLLCLAFVGLQMASTSRRFIPLFGVVGIPLVAATLRWLRDVAVRLSPTLGHPAAGMATTIVALLIGAGLWSNVRVHPSLLTRWTESNLYPDAGLRYMEALAPGEKLLSYYNWGGYIMLHAP